MLKSMTAFAAAEKSNPSAIVSVEIRTYNSRYLDIALRLPAGFTSLEEKVKSLLAETLDRGRVEVRLGFKDTSETACAFAVDHVKARAYVDAVTQLKESMQMTSEALSLDYLASVPGIISPADNARAAQDHWPLIADGLRHALADLERMRCQEGEFTGRDLAMRLDGIEQRLDQIESATGDMLTIYRDRLQARIEALTQGLVALDPVRIAQEAAILADRSDISEEITRARSHISQFRTILKDDEPSGRKLNFLLQEFNREFNTMGSKAGQAQVAHTIVDIKAEIEKMREQVQNIE